MDMDVYTSVKSLEGVTNLVIMKKTYVARAVEAPLTLFAKTHQLRKEVQHLTEKPVEESSQPDLSMAGLVIKVLQMLPENVQPLAMPKSPSL